MSIKILNFLAILTSLLGYLEWGKDKKLWLFQAESEIISKLFTNPSSVIHPLIILPLIGQILLLFTLFQKSPSKILTFLSLGGLGVLLVFLFFIGIISFNLKILFSTIPFLIVAYLIINNQIKTNR